MHTYVALHEVKPLEGCTLDPISIQGAFVRSYVLASSAQDARAKIGDALSASRFEVLHEQWLAKDDDVEWDDIDEEEIDAYCDEAATTGEVVFGPFHTWPAHGPAEQ